MNIKSTFSKGCKNSIALNACKGSGKFCSKNCPFHKNSKAKKYKDLNPFLRKHSDDFTGFLFGILSIMNDLQSCPWIRFSSFGSFPSFSELNNEQKEILQLIAKKLIPKIQSGLVHFPVETVSKYLAYRNMGFPTRLSNQEEYKGYRESRVVGDLRKPLKHRIVQATMEAKMLRTKGC